jgi:hypothetical protein
MSHTPTNTVPPPLPASSAPPAVTSAKRGWWSIAALVLAAGVAAFAVYSAVSPFFCTGCFYLETVSMNDDFAKFGYDRRSIQDTIVAADKTIEASDLPKRIFLIKALTRSDDFFRVLIGSPSVMGTPLKW